MHMLAMFTQIAPGAPLDQLPGYRVKRYTTELEISCVWLYNKTIIDITRQRIYVTTSMRDRTGPSRATSDRLNLKYLLAI